MQDGNHEKRKKLQYLKNLLIDFGDICFADAYGPSRHYGQKYLL